VHRHAAFDLWLHDDDELALALGSPLQSRETIHEWPLSCVQRLRTGAGSRHIYKVQAPPTVEAEFYARARSPLLVPVRALPAAGTTVALLMEEIDAPRLSDQAPTQPQAAEIAADLQGRIAGIEGDLPAVADIGSEEGWRAHIGTALADLRACVADGTFRRVDAALADRIARWCGAPTVLAAVRSPAGHVHADLKAENVLVVPGGYRVLDWQRPIRGPVALDAATLLISLGVDATRHVPVGVVQLHHLLRIAWFAQAAVRWFPQGRPWFDQWIAGIAGELEALDAGS